MYDITRRDTFVNVSRWLSELRANESHPDIIAMLFGNKSDLHDIREVSQDEAQSYAESNNLMYMETSALDNTNVELAFNTLVMNIYDQISSKLTTLDDKKVKLMRGQSVQLTPPTTNNISTQGGCAC